MRCCIYYDLRQLSTYTTHRKVLAGSMLQPMPVVPEEDEAYTIRKLHAAQCAKTEVHAEEPLEGSCPYDVDMIPPELCEPAAHAVMQPYNLPKLRTVLANVFFIPKL